MQRWVTTLVGFGVVALAVLLATKSFRPPTPIGHDPNPAPRAAEEDGGGLLYALGDAQPPDASGPLLLSDLVGPELRGDAAAGTTMPDGSHVPPLPMSAPRQVRVGVVLVSYEGAQPSAAGGRPTTRSKADAKALADRLLVTAAQDFHLAVQQGDPGSADDLGRVKLGILEPAPEYVLFSLPVDGIGGPVDTPRGYWIVKRLE